MKRAGRSGGPRRIRGCGGPSWFEPGLFAAAERRLAAARFESQTMVFGWAHGLGFIALAILIWVAVLRHEAPYPLLAATMTPVGPGGQRGRDAVRASATRASRTTVPTSIGARRVPISRPHGGGSSFCNTPARASSTGPRSIDAGSAGRGRSDPPAPRRDAPVQRMLPGGRRPRAGRTATALTVRTGLRSRPGRRATTLDADRASAGGRAGSLPHRQAAYAAPAPGAAGSAPA